MFCLLFKKGRVGSQIVTGPTIQTASVGEAAVFNCTLRCSEEVPTLTWYLVLPATLRKVSISPYTSLSQVKAVFGLDLSRNVIDECSSGGYRVEQLRLFNLTKNFDLMPIQCGLLCFSNVFGCKDAQILFSPTGVVKIAVPKGGWCACTF